MTMKKSLKVGMIAAAFSTTINPALADPIEDAIKARQSYYQVVSFNFGQMVKMVRGELDYDAEAAQVAADNLKSMSTLNVTAMFPAGSDNEAKKGKTRAQPNIWSDFPGVVEKVQGFQTAAATLAGVAGNGKDALAPAVGEVGKSCGACHDEYRAKNF